MRRTEIIAAAEAVDRLLEQTGIAALAAAAAGLAGSGDGMALADRVFDVYGRAAAETGRLTAAERHVLHSFGMQAMLDRDWWRSAMSEAAAGRAGALNALALQIRAFRTARPALQALVAPTTIAEHVQGGAEDQAKLDGLMLLLIDDAQHRSTPERLIAALSAVSTFYRVAARLEGHGEADLTVLGLDSGNDKSIELVGLAKVIAAVREIILSVYRRAAAYADLTGQERLQQIKADLPVLHDLGRLGAEQAEIFRRSLGQAVDDFVAAGTLIPEMLDLAGPAARQVMTPERKLLAQPSSAAAESDGLAEMQAMLQALRRERDDLVAALPPERRESLYRRLTAEGLA
ncbi:hypothetical protein ACFOGJ_21840 [Marinibaculum pumilum]|uniref:Response regulator receiver protein n=1 Tax=Marinibaculum pumilum TaxID=1766165 RepID=A0ABV7L5J1_9PROT